MVPQLSTQDPAHRRGEPETGATLLTGFGARYPAGVAVALSVGVVRGVAVDRIGSVLVLARRNEPRAVVTGSPVSSSRNLTAVSALHYRTIWALPRLLFSCVATVRQSWWGCRIRPRTHFDRSVWPDYSPNVVVMRPRADCVVGSKYRRFHRRTFTSRVRGGSQGR